MKNTIVKDFVMPIAVLTAICLVISGALALTNKVTARIIEETARINAENARKEALPAADGFDKLTLEEGTPETVEEAYKATNGAGYVFTLVTKGYGGKMKIMCSIDAEGKIVSVQLLEHSETQGIGSKQAKPENTDLYKGKDATTLADVPLIANATKTSKPFKAAIADAFIAYNMIKEG